MLTQESAGETSEIDEWFGWSLAVGDFDDDGRDDLAVGVPGEDSSQGMVCYFYGSNAGLSATGAGFFKQAALGLVANDGDQFGFSLAAGHLTETLVDDLAVGIAGEVRELAVGDVVNGKRGLGDERGRGTLFGKDR